MSSAQAIREVQHHFNPSTHFRPLLTAQADAQASSHKHDRNHRRGQARKRALQVKMGHGGTLDPAATGVLILGIGAGTKALPQFLSCTKTYEAVVLFGAATDTYDGEGKVVGKRSSAHVKREDVERVLREKFRGKFMQRPPIFSALNVDGKRAYEYAREGKQLPRELAEREVEVSEVECVEWLEGGSHEWKWPEVEAPKEDKEVAEKLADVVGETANGSPSAKRKRLEVDEDESVVPGPAAKQSRLSPSIPTSSADQDQEPTMSGALPAETHNIEDGNAGQSGNSSNTSPQDSDEKPPAARVRLTSSRGFYVRSLCHDLGLALGTYGLMAHLVRVRQGDFALKSGFDRSQIEAMVKAPDEGAAVSPKAGDAKTVSANDPQDGDGQDEEAEKSNADWPVLEFEELEKGENTWAPRVKAMLEHWNRAQSKSNA